MIHDDTNFIFNQYGRLHRDQLVCQDQYVGTIIYNNGCYQTSVACQNQDNDIFGLQKQKRSGSQQRDNIDYHNFRMKNNPMMVVVLESPHVSEFGISGQNFTTAPAWGKTGDRFNTQFIKLLNNHLATTFSKIKKIDYDIYFVNAIRYQTRLGLCPIIPVLRDYIFKDMWINYGFDDDFKERISILKPEIVINAVTKNLKQLVNDVITTTLTGSFCFQCSEHPIKWGDKTAVL